MAFRDKSQGFAFVYTDLAKILAERDKITRDNGGPVHPPETPSANFNKDKINKPVPNTSDDSRARTQAIAEIKDNLDRLQSLHHKLHAMLADLNKITDREKKRR
jgi:hypothetical protein